MTTHTYIYTGNQPGHMGRSHLFAGSNGVNNAGGTFICEDNTYAWAVKPRVGDTLTVTRDEQGVPVKVLVNGVPAWEYTPAEREAVEAAYRAWIRERMDYLQGESDDDPGRKPPRVPSQRFKA